ncbi:18050_t:CDS:2, partial [Gigaspora rosea]
MYCAGDGKTCQHQCGGIGECLLGCSNYNLPNNLKNGNDMHRCSVWVHSFSRLSYLNSSYQLRIKIEGIHHPSNMLMTNTPKATRINLTRQIRDQITINRCADHQTAKTIKGKLLYSLNGASEKELNKALLNSREICDNKKLERFIVREDRRLKDYAGPWTILHYLVEKILKPKGYVLYYQQPDLSKSENFEFWLRNGRDFWQACFGVDGKYDLNIDRAPVLTMVVENSARHGTLLAFAINAVKQNIPCNDPTCEHSWYYKDLPNNKGFRRICNCINQVWNPYTMIDKHYPTKLGVEGLVRGTILCWFHIMQTFEKAFKMANYYKNFLNTLPLTQDQKPSLTKDLDNNWMCNKWRLQFIDA